MSRSRHIRRILHAVVLILASTGFFWSPPAHATSSKPKRKIGVWKPSPGDTIVNAHPTIHAVVVDTPLADTSAGVSDTGSRVSEEKDTLIYSARPGGKFYHKISFAHAPQEGRRDVILADDTRLLSDTFEICPLCFERPVTEMDFELEDAIANQVAGIVEFRYRKLDDEAVANRLSRIGHPMTKHLDRSHLEFYFTPLRSSMEKNAISAGNGYIYYTSGLLNMMEDDDEVAAVLAHEIAHGEFRHVLQDFKLSQKLTLITTIASALINKAANIGGIFQVLQDYAAQLVMNGFSRQFELESDAAAKWLLVAEGRDTEAMRRVLLKLEDMSRDYPEQATVFRSHPEESDRIRAYDETKVFNLKVIGDTLSMRLKFQRPRVVGWFKERAVPALYASLVNESDTALYITDMKAEYHAPDMPKVKVEVTPSSVVIPERSYGQIKILVVAQGALSRHPTALDFSCSARKLEETAKKKTKDARKSTMPRISFHFDMVGK